MHSFDYFVSRRDTLVRTLVLCTVLGGLGCAVPDIANPSSAAPDQVFWAVSLNTRAVTMSTAPSYDTLRLIATPLNATGAPLPGVPLPTFTSSDSSVRVSPTGLLTARQARSNVLVIAELTYQGVRRADTAIVTVTNDSNPPEFRTLDFGLVPGDSAKMAISSLLGYDSFYFTLRKNLKAVVLDATGAQISNALIALRSSDSLQATVPATTGNGTAVVSGTSTSQRGFVTIYAEATIYGMTRRDSVRLALTTPLIGLFRLAKTTPPGGDIPIATLTPSTSVHIGIGGLVWWWNTLPDSLDIVFDDPAEALPEGQIVLSSDGDTVGNIPPFVGNADLDVPYLRGRRFPHAGTYHFHSARTGVSGTIFVE